MSNPIRIFTSSLDFVAEVDDYETAYFERRWYGIGEFSITINYNKLFATEFQKGRIILIGNNYDSCGIISSLRYSVGEGGKGSETVTASGYQLKHIMSWRIVYPPAGQARYTDSDKAESVVKTLVAGQAGTSAATKRQFSLLDIAADAARGIDYLISSRYSNLAAEVEDLAYATQISTNLYIDPVAKKIKLDCYQGIDRTAAQSMNGRAIFSPDYDTLASAEILDSNVAYRSIMIIGGQGVGAARTIVPVYSTTEPSDFDRREQWIDARDLSTTPDLTLRGQSKLALFGNENYLEARALTYSPLAYRSSYDLGDLVTMSAFGQSTNVRISSARESWANNDYMLELGYGLPYPTITKRVARSESDVGAILNATE
jgi:hypothetical protein